MAVSTPAPDTAVEPSTPEHSVGAAGGPMRLAVVIESFNPDAGGAEKSTAQIIDELVARGHHLTLITGACRPVHDPPEVRVLRLSRKKSSSVIRLLRFAGWAKKLLREGRYDASLSITMAVPASVVQPRGGTVRETLDRNIAMRRAGFRQFKKRVELALEPKQRLLLGLEQRTLADPDVRVVAAVSGYVVDQLERHYGFDPLRTRVIPNASVMPEIDDETRGRWRTELRRALGIGDDATAYLFAAQNPALKGVRTLLPAFAKLRETHSAAEPVLLLAGGYDHGVQRDVAALKLRDHVRLLGHSREMPTLYAAADVTVLPSWYDPSSKVVLESLMMRTPAVTTSYNGAGEYLQPPGEPARGRVVADPGDVAGLHAALADLADPAVRAGCVAACIGLREQLTMTRHVDALEALLRETVAA